MSDMDVIREMKGGYTLTDTDLVYGFVPETSLAGDYISNRCC